MALLKLAVDFGRESMLSLQWFFSSRHAPMTSTDAFFKLVITYLTLHTLMLLGIRLNELRMEILFDFSEKWNFNPLIINSIVVMNQKDGF